MAPVNGSNGRDHQRRAVDGKADQQDIDHILHLPGHETRQKTNQGRSGNADVKKLLF